MSSKRNTDIIDIKGLPCTGPSGMTKWTKDDWTLVAHHIPRYILENTNLAFTEKELSYNSIYFLVGNTENGEKIYVGRAERRADGLAVIPRLREHTKYTDAHSAFWNYAVAVTNKDGIWTSAEIHELEKIFYQEIPKESLENRAIPPAGGDERKDYREKARQIRAFLTAIGLQTFSDTEDAAKITIRAEENVGNVRVEDLHNGLSSIPEIITPKKVVNSILDTLPAEVWNPYTTFLDPACKGGEFLRAIYDRLMNAESLVAMYPDKVHRAFHIMDKQIFGIALSDISRDRTIRKLMDFDRNIITVPYYLSILKSSEDTIVLNGKIITFKERLEGLFGRKNMTFDVVVGNPPYQETTGAGNNGGKVLYDSFIRAGMHLGNKVCMIVKNNWMNSDSLKEVRETIVNNGCSKLINYSLLGDIFPSLGISASIILTEKGYSGNTEYTEIQKGAILNKYNANLRGLGFVPTSLDELSIVCKMKSKDCFNKHVVGVVPFGISTDGKISGRGFIDEAESKSDYYNIKLVYAKYSTYTNIHCFRKNRELVNTYKVICPKQIHKTSMTVPSVMILKPGEICSGQYSLLYCSDNYDEAKAVESYVKTRTFRFLVNCLADTLCSFAAYRMSLIPNQDFSSSSDINWLDSISDIDKQLYKKYGLSNAEIDCIEKTIKPME